MVCQILLVVFIELFNSQGRNADGLAQYFGEDPARYPFELGKQACHLIICYTWRYS